MKCPFCAKEIQDAAIKCRHCGEWLEPNEAVREAQEQHHGNLDAVESWEEYAARFRQLSHADQQKEWAKLSDRQKSSLSDRFPETFGRVKKKTETDRQAVTASVAKPVASKEQNPALIGCLALLGISVVFGFCVSYVGKDSRTGTVQVGPAERNAISVVASRLEPWRGIDGRLNVVSAGDLRSKKNPRGKGDFVFVPKERSYPRLYVWLVLDGQAYPLNGPAKSAAPSLKWPRETPDSIWNQTGLSRYRASDALEIVFGE